MCSGEVNVVFGKASQSQGLCGSTHYSVLGYHLTVRVWQSLFFDSSCMFKMVESRYNRIPLLKSLECNRIDLFRLFPESMH